MKFKKIILTEETLGQAIQDADSKEEAQAIQKAGSALGSDTEVEEYVGDMEKALDDALEDAIDAKDTGAHSWTNVLFIGLAGIGKTGRIRAWANKQIIDGQKLNVVAKSAATMDQTDLGGAVAADLNKDSKTYMSAVKLKSNEMDVLDETPSILFLDELNRARTDIRGTLLTLIQDHMVPDPTLPDGMKYLKNFYFTVAAINPSSGDMEKLARKYNWEITPEDQDAFNVDQLDDAEMSRFSVEYMAADPIATANYLQDVYKDMAEILDQQGKPDRAEVQRGKADLANKILRSPRFSFDTPADIRRSKEEGNGLQLNPRTFQMAIDKSKGTKKGLLDTWDKVANSTRKHDIETILQGYVEKHDKANAVLKRGSQSDLFKNNNTVSAYNKMQNSGLFDMITEE